MDQEDFPSSGNEALREACDDLIGSFQDLHYRIKNIEDFDGYGIQDSLLECIEEILARHDALE